MKCTLVWGTTLLVAAVPCGAEVRISAPSNDTIVTDNQVTVRGTAEGAAGGMVQLEVGGMKYTAPVVNGGWEVKNVAVPTGVTVWTASRGGAAARVVITKGSGIKNRPQQRVRFVWKPDVEEDIKAVALRTLAKPPGPKALPAFVEGVKAQTALAFLRAYEGVDIEVVETGGKDTHEVEMVDYEAPAYYGRYVPPLPDCGNADLEDSCEVWVGSYRKSMVEEFADWSPMDRKDPWQVRMVDLGEALGRSAAHEVGHSLGLVGFGKGPCGWMLGCGGHNCLSISLRHATVKRFDRGRFIMDPGPHTLNVARLGEVTLGRRAGVRSPAVFNPFNRSYLRIIHPVP